MTSIAEAALSRKNKNLEKLHSSKRRPSVSQNEQHSSSREKFVKLYVNEISLNENVRRKIDTHSSDFINLCESLKKNGLIQIPLVEKREKNDDVEYVCVDGHRRILALKEIGFSKQIPCLLKEYYGKIENRLSDIIASDLKNHFSFLEKIDVAGKLKSEGLTLQEIADIFQNDKKYVGKIVKLSQLSENSKKLIEKNIKKFSAYFLIKEIAEKKLTQKEIETVLKNKILGVNSNSKKRKLIDDVNLYFTENHFSPNEKSKTLNLLKHLQLI